MVYFINIGSSKLEGQQLTRTREEKLILIKHECWSDSDMLRSSHLQEVNTDNLKQQVYGKVIEVQYAVWAKEWRKGTTIFLWIDDIMQVVCSVAMRHGWVRVCNLCPPVSDLCCSMCLLRQIPQVLTLMTRSLGSHFLNLSDLACHNSPD